MIPKKFKSVFCIICLFILACTTATKKPIIQFSNDSTSIEIVGVNKGGYYTLEKRQQAGDSLMELVSVVESPGENDSSSVERSVPGTVVLKEDKIQFIPDSAFKSGKEYIVFTFVDISLGGTKEMLRGELNTKGKPWQQTLIK